MERYLIGTSLSMCLRDIIKGEVNEENVVLIVTGTKRDFESESTHYVAQDCPDLYKESEEVAHEILDRLWKQGRIHQLFIVGCTLFTVTSLSLLITAVVLLSVTVY